MIKRNRRSPELTFTILGQLWRVPLSLLWCAGLSHQSQGKLGLSLICLEEVLELRVLAKLQATTHPLFCHPCILLDSVYLSLSRSLYIYIYIYIQGLNGKDIYIYIFML